MLAPTRSALLGFACGTRRAVRVTLAVEPAAAAAAPRPAPRPRPRRVAAGLEGLLTDGARVAQPNPALSAARAFAAGDGFLPGQIIDRSI